jgi:hypothetical protein
MITMNVSFTPAEIIGPGCLEWCKAQHFAHNYVGLWIAVLGYASAVIGYLFTANKPRLKDFMSLLSIAFMSAFLFYIMFYNR